MRTLPLLSILALALSALGCGSTCHAVANDDAAAASFPLLTWEEVSAAMQDGAILADARRPEGYAEGHIEGAVNVPVRDQVAFDKLPADKSAKLIFYCGGPYCRASLKAATRARELGYTNVAEYRGGYPEWKKLTATCPATAEASAR